MQNGMLMTMKPLKCLLAAVLVHLLDSGLVVAAAKDWLPLAVGNSWTYSHLYADSVNPEEESQWSNYTASLGYPKFTISVMRTEVINDTTYFVLSDMPDLWPPPPSYFISGKKLRWAGDLLMERTDDGERQSVYRFGGASGASESNGTSYAVATQEGFTQGETVLGGRFRFDEEEGTAGASGSQSKWWGWSAGWATFLKGFGVHYCGLERGTSDATPLFKNSLTATQAVINGRTVTVEQAMKEAHARASSSAAPSRSWGLVKQGAR